MNKDTRVAIHCYAGDARQVIELLPIHRQHECPITILSPDDSRVDIPGEDCRFGGKRQSIGPLSIEREREHLRILLTYPENFFLLNDADSVCISPKLPDYLYREPNVLWSCMMQIDLPNERAALTAKGHPLLTFHPPYFLSRWTIEKLLAQPYTTADRFDGFIDHWITEATMNAGIVFKGYPDCYSGPISTTPLHLEKAFIKARHEGAIFFHSVKTPQFWQPLVAAHEGWLDDLRLAADFRPRHETNTTAGVATDSFVRLSGNDDGLTYLRPYDTPPAPPQPTPRRQHRDQIGRLIGRIK